VPPALRPVGHEDRLSLIEHLDELRTRIVISLLAFGIVFALCLWQDDRVLSVINEPVKQTAFQKGAEESRDPLERSAIAFAQLAKTAAASAEAFDRLAAEEDDAARAREYRALAGQQRALADAAPSELERRPVTFKVGEPFTATLRVAAYAALLLTLPLLLYQAFAFVLPAFSPGERRVALPLMILAPFLFFTGVVFGYFIVLPGALDFLQNFNDDQFDILLQAQDLYKFSVTVLIAMGLVFEVPVVVLAITRTGIISIEQLRRQRRYAIVVIAVIAMLLPGTDPVTFVSIMVPLLLLYEGSILLAALLERRAERREGAGDQDLD
jgi:sec-independent protein translocase protein TatC